jgi:hypothetical protein
MREHKVGQAVWPVCGGRRGISGQLLLPLATSDSDLKKAALAEGVKLI